ncbi:MAG: signal peptidase II [Dehalococcoidia bacterium]|nr:signal peptidase II [Dehalococcoidia bacterium]
MTITDSPPGKLKNCRVLITTTIVLVILDQFSKLWVRTNIIPGSFIPDEGFIRLTYTTNTGAVFGIFPNQTLALAIASSLTIVLIIFLRKYLSLHHFMTDLSFGLLLGGAIGNLIDRLWLHRVTDFIAIQLWHDFLWPPFNLADSGVVLGIIILIYSIITTNKNTQEFEQVEPKNGNSTLRL